MQSDKKDGPTFQHQLDVQKPISLIASSSDEEIIRKMLHETVERILEEVSTSFVANFNLSCLEFYR